jgi:anti-sigma factor RsiW
MSCEFTEKVSALVDEELEEREAENLRRHIAACETCGQAEKEFLLLKREIKSYPVTEWHGARGQRTLRHVLGSGNVPLWKKRIALPVPALAGLLLALMVPGIWMASSRWQKASMPVETAREEKRPVPPPARSESEIDLARFDHGGRAIIYKVRRDDSENVKQ